MKTSAPAPISILPKPVSQVAGKGLFVLGPDTRIQCDEAATGVGELLARRLRAATGFDIPVQSGGGKVRSAIRLHLTPALADGPPEGYTLGSGAAGVAIDAGSPAGLFYGTQTLLQLLPPEVFRDAPAGGVTWSVPGVAIQDFPRFGWRGLMLDVSRHFMPMPFLKRFMDLMALHKFNVLHLHLVDDQGWRLEIKRYPRLTGVGAWREGTTVNHEHNRPRFTSRVPHGGFYSQADVRELVEYGRRRMITIVPEIEMPGHAQAAIAAYPELGNLDTRLEVSCCWGVHRNILRPSRKTVRFMRNVLAEVMELFPSPFIHIGGDEAVKDQWKAGAEAQAMIRKLRLQDEHELQSWFIREMDDFLTAHKRRLVGWDEILEGGLAKGATVMAWRPQQRGDLKAAQAGHDVVMATTDYTYFDYYQDADFEREPLAIGGLLPLEKVYAFEPVSEQLTAAQASHILGAQGQLWSEYIPTPSLMEYMAFPRAAALAERVWSQAGVRRFDEFMRRLRVHTRRMDVLGVNYRRE